MKRRLVAIVGLDMELDQLEVAAAIEQESALSQNCWHAARLFSRCRRMSGTEAVCESWIGQVKCIGNARDGRSTTSAIERIYLRSAGMRADGSDDAFVRLLVKSLLTADDVPHRNRLRALKESKVLKSFRGRALGPLMQGAIAKQAEVQQPMGAGRAATAHERRHRRMHEPCALEPALLDLFNRSVKQGRVVMPLGVSNRKQWDDLLSMPSMTPRVLPPRGSSDFSAIDALPNRNTALLSVAAGGSTGSGASVEPMATPMPAAGASPELSSDGTGSESSSESDSDGTGSKSSSCDSNSSGSLCKTNKHNRAMQKLTCTSMPSLSSVTSLTAFAVNDVIDVIVVICFVVIFVWCLCCACVIWRIAVEFSMGCCCFHFLLARISCGHLLLLSFTVVACCCHLPWLLLFFVSAILCCAAREITHKLSKDVVFFVGVADCKRAVIDGICR